MKDWLLDASIYWSFDKSGYLRHSQQFLEEISFHPGKKALITGGTSGIGRACADFMSKRGVSVTITGRNQQKGEKALQDNSSLNFIQWDMANWGEIPKIVEDLDDLDYLVLNAGGMPDSYQTNEEGVEAQFASQLFGHFYFSKLLQEKGKLKKGARIVWVTSGGMYLRSLELKSIFYNHKYDKVATYANVKRAQVTLLPYLKEQFPDQTVVMMHPGWAETPGVDSAIPGFAEKMQGRLRTPLEGGDTILWLLATSTPLDSGSLYFDRKKVKNHLFWFTKKSDKLLPQLIKILEDQQPKL